MEIRMPINSLKSALRNDMRARRHIYFQRNPSPDLYRFFKDPNHEILNTSTLAGFSPIHDEIDIWPLLSALQNDGRRIGLPVVTGAKESLVFREWTPDCPMETDRFGVSIPAANKPMSPRLILVPLLAFTARGERLGYGGGYYDRTLAALRAQSEIFACGVAYAGQEVDTLPTDEHDERLDGILTEDGFRRLT